jgi:hypothetical protein
MPVHTQYERSTVCNLSYIVSMRMCPMPLRLAVSMICKFAYHYAAQVCSNNTHASTNRYLILVSIGLLRNSSTTSSSSLAIRESEEAEISSAPNRDTISWTLRVDTSGDKIRLSHSPEPFQSESIGQLPGPRKDIHGTEACQGLSFRILY